MRTFVCQSNHTVICNKRIKAWEISTPKIHHSLIGNVFDHLSIWIIQSCCLHLYMIATKKHTKKKKEIIKVDTSGGSSTPYHFEYLRLFITLHWQLILENSAGTFKSEIHMNIFTEKLSYTSDLLFFILKKINSNMRTWKVTLSDMLKSWSRHKTFMHRLINNG